MNYQEIVDLAIRRLCSMRDEPTYDALVQHMYYFYCVKKLLDRCGLCSEVEAYHPQQSFFETVDKHRDTIETVLSIYVTDVNYMAEPDPAPEPHNKSDDDDAMDTS